MERITTDKRGGRSLARSRILLVTAVVLMVSGVAVGVWGSYVNNPWGGAGGFFILAGGVTLAFALTPRQSNRDRT